MGFLQPILEDFEKDRQRVDHLLNLIKLFREFGASAPPKCGEKEIEWSAATALLEASKTRRTDLPLLAGALQMYLAGRFEFFIRQLVEAVADEISASCGAFSDLPDVVRAEIKIKTLEVAQNPRRFGYDELSAEALLSDLAGNLAGSVSIRSVVLTITESNMKDRVLADVLRRVGITDFWKEVGKQNAMKILLGTASDGETTAEAIGKLNALMDDRNQIAHPTGNTVFPDPDQVLSVSEYLGALAETTADVAEIHAAKFKRSRAAALSGGN